MGVVPMTDERRSRGEPRWLYPMLYLFFAAISFLPLYAQEPYASQEIQDVIVSVLIVATEPYEHLAPLFHVATLLIVVLIAFFGARMGRVLAAYMGLNYLVLALIPTMGTTEQYGFVIHSGALFASFILGITWIVVAIQGELKPSFKGVPTVRYLLLPLALLAFWTPVNAELEPHFDPLLLLMSPSFGLYFCMTAPVFLFLLVLFFPRVSLFAYKITAFNGLIYGLVNMVHFFHPQRRWMGVLHLPLLLISVYALLLPRLSKGAHT
jgi:hypothetical protein